MTDTSPFAGVIFDMDGVLCDSEPFITEAAVRMFAQRHDTAVQHEDFKPFTGTGEDRFLGGVAEKYSVSLNMPDDKTFVYDTYLEIIKGQLGPLPGVLDFVALCREHGLKLAVATSADRVKMDGNLREIGVPSSHFDACVTGSDVTHKKPDPEVFLTAAKMLGLPPSECLVVEDAPQGIVAGKAAGAACLGLTTSFDDATLREAGADWTSPDLSGVTWATFGSEN